MAVTGTWWHPPPGAMGTASTQIHKPLPRISGFKMRENPQGSQACLRLIAYPPEIGRCSGEGPSPRQPLKSSNQESRGTDSSVASMPTKFILQTETHPVWISLDSPFLGFTQLPESVGLRIFSHCFFKYLFSPPSFSSPGTTMT